MGTEMKRCFKRTTKTLTQKTQAARDATRRKLGDSLPQLATISWRGKVISVSFSRFADAVRS